MLTKITHYNSIFDIYIYKDKYGMYLQYILNLRVFNSNYMLQDAKQCDPVAYNVSGWMV